MLRRASADNKLDDYTDAKDIGEAYVEAVGVMTGLEIVDGMTETTIDPTATYTREQAAKIIAYMVLGKTAADSLTCTVAPFDDVAADRWSAGYISFCVEQGIIDGMTDTTFEPTGTLTGFQWAKMLLSAVGFNAKGEFTGDSWSLNTARVAHSVGLFSGDAAGADHVALQRQQAMLYAFNTLTSVGCVVYSEALGDYFYKYSNDSIGDRVTPEDTLGVSVFKLHSVEGQVVDNEGMGASATYVDSLVASEGDVKIDADTGLDLMYHAVRVWYVAGTTNTSVYVNDLATVTTTTCPFATLPTTRVTIGEKGEAYQLDVVDNSALNLGTTNVVFVADWGTMGFVDSVTKRTSVESRNNAVADTSVLTDDVMSDVTGLDYGDMVIYLLTNSTKEAATNEALYIEPVTSTVGTVESFAQDANGKFTVTLTDGTELEESVFYNPANDDTEFFRGGNVYTFVLDTHGDVIYATRDFARDLYVYTGETRNTGNYNDISSDQGTEWRFINVSTGNEYWAPVVFVDNDDSSIMNYLDAEDVARGQYYDISATANDDGDYIAELIEVGDNTYASGYEVNNWNTFVIDNDTIFVPGVSNNGQTVYYDEETVTFLVATGLGSSMTVTPYVGVQAFKDALGIADDGSISLINAAMTVSPTSTGDWNASVVFVLNENVRAESNYVFIPEDIDSSDWTFISSSVDSYIVRYSGAYMNGTAITVEFDGREVVGPQFGANSQLDRGFYTMRIRYDVNGNAIYRLVEKVDNAWNEECYYLNVTLSDTGNSSASSVTWYLQSNGFRRYAADANTLIVDTTGHGLNSFNGIDAYMDSHPDAIDLAFTVNPNTNRVNVVYVVDAGWDAQITVELTNELIEAGWIITKVSNSDDTIVYNYDIADEETSVEINDANAEALVGNDVNVVLYNAKLAGKTTYSTEYSYYVNTTTNVGYSKLNNGYIGVQVDVDGMTRGEKDNEFTIGGLVIGSVTIEAGDGRKVGSVTPNEDIVLGKEVTVKLETASGGEFTIDNATCDETSHYHWEAKLQHDGNTTDYVIDDGKLTTGNHVVEFTFVPYHIDTTYTVSDADWVHNANVVD